MCYKPRSKEEKTVNNAAGSFQLVECLDPYQASSFRTAWSLLVLRLDIILQLVRSSRPTSTVVGSFQAIAAGAGAGRGWGGGGGVVVIGFSSMTGTSGGCCRYTPIATSCSGGVGGGGGGGCGCGSGCVGSL